MNLVDINLHAFIICSFLSYGEKHFHCNLLQYYIPKRGSCGLNFVITKICNITDISFYTLQNNISNAVVMMYPRFPRAVLPFVM